MPRRHGYDQHIRASKPGFSGFLSSCSRRHGIVDPLGIALEWRSIVNNVMQSGVVAVGHPLRRLHHHLVIPDHTLRSISSAIYTSSIASAMVFDGVRVSTRPHRRDDLGLRQSLAVANRPELTKCEPTTRRKGDANPAMLNPTAAASRTLRA